MAELRLKCAACGAPFIGQRRTAKFCSASCRARTSQGKVSPLKRAEPDPERDRPSSLPAVRAALEDAGVAGSALGGVALVLAEQLDRGVGRAAEARELRALMTELTRAGAASPADELGVRRASKLAGA